MAVQKKSSKVSIPKVNEHLKNIIPYPPGKPIEEVQREFGLDSVIKLASNENPLGPSPKAIKAMQAVAGEMNLYPDGAGFYLKDALAKRLGVSTGELSLSNGTDELLVLLAQAYLGLGEFAKAAVQYEYAYGLNPFDPRVYQGLALCQEKLGKDDKAAWARRQLALLKNG